MFLVFFLEFIFLFSLLFIFFDVFYYYVKFVKQYGKPKQNKQTFQESSFFYKFFRDFPRLLARYFYENHNNFNEYGIVIFYGPQGSGKTMSVCHYAQKLYTKYPKAKIGSNFNFLLRDFDIKGWKSLVKEKNGDEPIIFCFDEVNQWANSRNWSKMPMYVLGEVAYQRKNKRVILGTAQSIAQIDKQIRIQCASGEFRRCFCFLGFINLVFRFKPSFDTEGNLLKKHFVGFYWFFQDEVLRYLYDTLQVIEQSCEV